MIRTPDKVIGLATPREDPDRFAAAQAHFAEVGIAVDGWVHGLHKSNSGLDTAYPYDVDHPGTGFHIGPHPVHIWLGHYFIWQALKVSGDRAWLVLECDAKFGPGGAQGYWDALNDTPADCDVLYLGSCCCVGRPKTRVGGTEAQGIYAIHGNAPLCNHAYWIRREAVEVLEFNLRKVWAPIDIQQVSECYEEGTPLPHAIPPDATHPRKLKAYAVLPRLADQWQTDIGG